VAPVCGAQPRRAPAPEAEQRSKPDVAGAAAALAGCAGQLASPASNAAAGEDASSLPLVAFMPHRGSRQSQNTRARACARRQAPACQPPRNWPFCRAERLHTRPAWTRGIGGGAILFGRAAALSSSVARLLASPRRHSAAPMPCRPRAPASPADQGWTVVHSPSGLE
jgi:hypothetical protein